MISPAHFLLFGVLFAVPFCGVVGEAGNVAMRTLAKGGFSGIQEPMQTVIKTHETWDTFWALHTRLASPPPPSPAVNFDKEMVIAVTLGRQRTGGYAIEIVRVQTTDKHLKVFVKRTAPPPGVMTLQALTAPFDFVAVPKSKRSPEFLEVKPDASK